MTGAACNVIAGCFAMAAFAVAILAGLAAGNAPSSILLRALIAMVVCYPVGLMIGLVCQRVVADHFQSQEPRNAGAGQGAEASVPDQSTESAERTEDVPVV